MDQVNQRKIKNNCKKLLTFVVYGVYFLVGNQNPCPAEYDAELTGILLAARNCARNAFMRLGNKVPDRDRTFMMVQDSVYQRIAELANLSEYQMVFKLEMGQDYPDFALRMKRHIEDAEDSDMEVSVFQIFYNTPCGKTVRIAA